MDEEKYRKVFVPKDPSTEAKLNVEVGFDVMTQKAGILESRENNNVLIVTRKTVCIQLTYIKYYKGKCFEEA